MLKLININKSFPGVKALDDVSIEFKEGEIHALLGENGAGKSTAMNIICGVYRADSGKVYLNEKELIVHNFIDALRNEINIVNQEIQVIGNRTLTENIMLDKMPRFGRTEIINWRKAHRIAGEYLKLVGLDISPTENISTLSVAHKQLVEIAKALSANAKILLLDEPTSALSENGVRHLFVILKKLKEKGIIIIFITHKLEEVIDNCDTVTVLRDGKVIDTKQIKEVDRASIVKMMIGREEKIESFINKSINNKKVLEAKNITKGKKAKNISFELNEGEILGFYGLVGSGRTELARLIIGEDQMKKGEIFINGEKVKIKSISDALYRYGIGYVTENRKEEGLFLFSTVTTNICITVWPKIASKIFRFISSKRERSLTEDIVKKMEIKTPSLEQIVNKLSGGNQQKVSIAKWLISNCQIMIFDEPTIGIDVGAKEAIHQLIFDLATKERKSIILISSDMPEIIKVANRILVFRENTIVGEIENSNKGADNYSFTSKEIGAYLA
ncbi:MAG: sugar ABC transporter ATP-binding protein [Candidatus Humimicrobiaceae bacterium]